MAEQPEGQSCATCRYYQMARVEHRTEYAMTASQQMGCKRYPASIARRPLPMAGEWCGEYAPDKPATLPEAAVAIARQLLVGDGKQAVVELRAAMALIDRMQEGT